jgi:deoxyribonuclease I
VLRFEAKRFARNRKRHGSYSAFLLGLFIGFGGGSAQKVAFAAPDRGNQVIPNFTAAKKQAYRIHEFWQKTLYCRCAYVGKTVDWKSCQYVPGPSRARAKRIEMEHVVPAEAFGHSFKEWREGDEKCVRKKRAFKGRKCAEKNAEFSRMEGDLYNLFPEVGEVNQMRSNYSMAEIGTIGGLAGQTFGGCKARIYQSKFEPMPFAKGTVARTYSYMEWAYPGRGIISAKNRKLFEAWDRQYPVEQWECERYRKILSIQKNENPFLQERCQKAGF